MYDIIGSSINTVKSIWSRNPVNVRLYLLCVLQFLEIVYAVNSTLVFEYIFSFSLNPYKQNRYSIIRVLYVRIWCKGKMDECSFLKRKLMVASTTFNHCGKTSKIGGGGQDTSPPCTSLKSYIIPYTRKFLRVPIFVVFMDDCRTMKLNPRNTVFPRSDAALE